MQKNILAGIAVTIIFVVATLGVVSAAPNGQTPTEASPFDLLIATLTDAYDRGLLPDTVSDLLSDLLIEDLITPHTGRTPEQARERLSLEGQSSLQFLITVLKDANDKGVLTDTVSDLLSDWFIESLITPRTGETPEQARTRLAPQTPFRTVKTEKVLAALVDFQDVNPAERPFTRTDIVNLLNDNPDSLKEFISHTSRGLVNVEFDVLDWITVDKKRTDYPIPLADEHLFITDVVSAMSNYADLSQYDKVMPFIFPLAEGQPGCAAYLGPLPSTHRAGASH